MIEIVKTDARTITLERYRIQTEDAGRPLKVRAWLLLTSPHDPAEMRLRIDYQLNDLPSQQELARRLVRDLSNRIG